MSSREHLSLQRHLVETYKRVATLKTSLEAITIAKRQPNYPAPMRDELLQKSAGLAWPAVPEYVSTLDLGGGLLAERAEDQMRHVPENDRRTWSLQELDLHGARLSQSVGKQWTSYFPMDQRR